MLLYPINFFSENFFVKIFSKTACTHCVTITILPSRPRFYVWNLVSVFLRVEPCLDFTPVVIISLRSQRNPLGYSNSVSVLCGYNSVATSYLWSIYE